MLNPEERILAGAAPVLPDKDNQMEDGDTFDEATGEYLGNIKPLNSQDYAAFPVKITTFFGGMMFEYQLVDKFAYSPEQTKEVNSPPA